jgi:hypothetical protein
MLLKSSGSGRFLLDVSEAELLLLNNALNEICNGVHLDEAEFSTRLGVPRDEARRLLRLVSAALKGIGPAPA